MNFFRSEKISLTEDNLVAEVEAGMRDFVRGDVADLRRPARLPTTTDTVLEPSTVAAVNNINSLVERVAGPSLTEITNLISPKVIACNVRCQATASSVRSPTKPRA